MPIAVVDIGGAHVKVLVEGDPEATWIESGPQLTPERMVTAVREVLRERDVGALALAIPGPVRDGRVVGPPPNLGDGWVGFDFRNAFGIPARVENDAALAALGAHRGGRMLFLGLGTGLGTCLVDGGRVVNLELAHLPFRDGRSFEDEVGQRGLERLGEAAWREAVAEVVERLRAATVADDVVLGGGNVRLLDELPEDTRRGDPELAFEGGFRLWHGGAEASGEGRERADAFPEIVRSPVWHRLTEHRRELEDTHLRRLFEEDSRRFERFSLTLDDPESPLLVDFSKHRVTGETMRLLFDLARRAGVEILRDRMFAGERINLTEDRAVLHVALRNRSDRPFHVREADGVAGEDVMPAVRRELARLKDLTDRIRSGAWTGWTGKAVTDVVHIGIGGSHLGPAMAAEALTPFHDGPRLHFVSNVDGSRIEETLRGLDPETALFCIASKSFTTQETLTNGRTARAWFLDHAGDPGQVKKHFVALSTNEPAVVEFGIAPENRLGFWDWVGGRYSLWSVIGLPVAVAVGFERFEALLDGAHAMDEHFRTAPLEENLPVVLGLLGVWCSNFWGFASHAVLPYDQHLARLPAHLQQLDMESNGKRVTRQGRPVAIDTGPLVWGETGTDGQHAFFQLLHQGTRGVPADFLLAARPAYPAREDHHRVLTAHALAQTEALMRGKTEEEVRRELAAEGLEGEELEALVPHRVFPGSRPTTTILYRRLDPRTLGRLLALYEHKVLVQGAIWNINSFDQWGVELGKQLAGVLLPELTAAEEPTGHDGSTRGLLAAWRRWVGH